MKENNLFNLSLISHEFKAPLSAILNLVKLIEINLDSCDEEKVRRYLSMISSQTIYLKNYISNTIEFGKMQTGKSELILEDFDVVELISEVAEITKILVENKPVKIITQFPLKSFSIYSDPIKLKQILINIASNSAKFTKQGYILFSFHVDNEITITIEDTGCGIDKEKINEIFNPYQNTDSKIYESSGLGLYITKELLRILNGSIKIESEYGKGTRVFIRVPRRSQ
ncbi:sensor histidine kinase [Thermodesulfovibrio hydrogeniphilus]